MIEQTEDYKTTSQNFMIEQTEDYKTNITKLHDGADRGL